MQFVYLYVYLHVAYSYVHPATVGLLNKVLPWIPFCSSAGPRLFNHVPKFASPDDGCGDRAPWPLRA